MKIILTLLALVSAASAQLVPITPSERQLTDIDRNAAAVRYYLEQAASALGRLHGSIFITDDATLETSLERLGQQQSEALIGLYLQTAEGVNTMLAAAGSTVTAPTTRTRDWVWANGQVTITPLPLPEIEPVP